jgi:hypothetical protein
MVIELQGRTQQRGRSHEATLPTLSVYPSFSFVNLDVSSAYELFISDLVRLNQDVDHLLELSRLLFVTNAEGLLPLID